MTIREALADSRMGSYLPGFNKGELQRLNFVVAMASLACRIQNCYKNVFNASQCQLVAGSC